MQRWDFYSLGKREYKNHPSIATKFPENASISSSPRWIISPLPSPNSENDGRWQSLDGSGG
jgi:hypothetical protein